MEHYKEGHYDDDLTVGIDEYDDDIGAGDVDLFDYVGDDESPLSRLKSIILSIDWEITDDILRQFNEELHDLQDIWAGNKVNLIYVQALEKLSRYIYKEKSSAHPNAIKLLLTFYANLEKIVSDENITEHEKKVLLREDVEKFEKLKRLISPAPVPSPAQQLPEHEEIPPLKEAAESVALDVAASQKETIESEALLPPSEDVFGQPGDEDPLLNLKAIVYGIDWEVTDHDLNNLSREVKRLEQEFITSKPQQIFLQGIGSLGAYINLKRSNAHADAFKLLHSFYVGLEKVVRENLSGQAEKNVLFPEVDKFNAFKELIAETISPDALSKSSAKTAEDEEIEDDGEIQPAFADVPEHTHGFQEEQEAAARDAQEQDDTIDEYFDDDEGEVPEDVDDQELASEMESRLDGMFEEVDENAGINLDPEVALQGVDVETEADDESDEEPLPEEDGELAPALAGDGVPEEESPAVFAEKVDEFFEEHVSDDSGIVGKEIPGVDVEHEADDDSEEEPLPYEDGELAPALGDDDRHVEREIEGDELAESDVTAEEEVEIDKSLDSFFDEPSVDIEIDETAKIEADSVEEKSAEEPSEVNERITDFFGEDDSSIVEEIDEEPLEGVDVETPEDDDSQEEPLPYEEDGEIAPALSGGDVDTEEEEEATDGEEAFAEGELDDGFDQLLEGDEEKEIEEVEEEEEVENRFDNLFGVDDDEVTTDTDQTTIDEDEAKDEIASFADGEQLIQGTDVETEDDDDSEEEPLPFEDGELAPALAGSDEDIVDQDDELVGAEESEEEEIGDRFDSFFGSDDQETEPVEEVAAAEKEELDEEPRLAEDLDSLAEAESLEEVLDETEEMETAISDLSTFEEIEAEDIEEFPEEDEVQSDDGIYAEGETDTNITSEEDEILELLGGDQEIEPALMEFEEEDEIPEVTAEELGAITDDSDAVKTAGDIPAGYPSTEELLKEFGAIAGEKFSDTITHPEGDESFIVAVEGLEPDQEDEEEVIFEPVDEDEWGQTTFGLTDEIVGESIEDSALEKIEDTEDDDSSFIGTTILTDQPVDSDAQALFEELSDISDVPGEFDKGEDSAYIEPVRDESAEDALGDLRSCIISLGLEIDDSILNSLHDEIEKLRHVWLDRPAERTFIQLLSTVAGHIERYRYEADAEANKLLLSVFDKLEGCVLGKVESSEIQEAILGETSKVLQWQNRLIDRTPSAKSDDTVGVEEKPFTGMDKESDSGAVLESHAALDEISRKVDDIGNDMLMQKVSSVMKAEIEQLKSAFQAELRELREELLRKGSKE